MDISTIIVVALMAATLTVLVLVERKSRRNTRAAQKPNEQGK